MAKPSSTVVKIAGRSQRRERERVTQILVIDDDLATRDLLRQILSDEGYELLLAERLDHAPADAAPDLVIADLVGLTRYANTAARAVVGYLHALYPGTPVIVCTAYEQATSESDRLGAEAVLLKPFTIEELVQTVARLAGQAPGEAGE